MSCFLALQQSQDNINTILNYSNSLLYSVYSEMPSPKQFGGLITTRK